MSGPKNNSPSRYENDWLLVLVAVGAPLIATTANPQVTSGVTFVLLEALTAYYLGAIRFDCRG